MAGLARPVSRRWRVVRQHPWVRHALDAFGHYSAVGGNAQAGAVTFYGFLSFFPLLALAFFAVGAVSRVYAEADQDLVRAVSMLFPGMLGDGPSQISLQLMRDRAGAVGLIGLAGVLYAGLGWLSGMRQALVVMFELPRPEQPNPVVGKLRDLRSLLLIGSLLVGSVAASGFVAGFSAAILRWLAVDQRLAPLLDLLTLALGLAANGLLFFGLFRLLADPPLRRSSLVRGALLGAVGFEVLKVAANNLISLTQGKPAFQAFGVALLLLVWINYFSRLVMLSAAWAYTDHDAVRRRAAAG